MYVFEIKCFPMFKASTMHFYMFTMTDTASYSGKVIDQHFSAYPPYTLVPINANIHTGMEYCMAMKFA